MIHPSALAGSVVLGRVQAVTDPDNLARVEVRFPLHVDEESNASTAWAPVATSFAGDNHGAFMLPGVGDVVVLSFVGGDTRQPIVLGAIWNGEESPSETVGGDNTDRWVITSRAGTRIAIIEESGGQPLVEITTPAGPMITLSDEGGGKIDLSTGGSTISMTPSAISIKSASIELNAPEVSISGGPLQVNSAMTNFSNPINAPVGVISSVIATSYTPGAGNVW